MTVLTCDCGWSGVPAIVHGAELCPICARESGALDSDPPGRNDPCPCASGRKWKRCHGAG